MFSLLFYELHKNNTQGTLDVTLKTSWNLVFLKENTNSWSHIWKYCCIGNLNSKLKKGKKEKKKEKEEANVHCKLNR